jgi:CHAT domain-containing protein
MTSPNDLWLNQMNELKKWIESGFKEESSAKKAIKILEEWVGLYPNQAADISKIALSASFTAMYASAYEVASCFSNAVLEISAFGSVTTPDESSATALAALILAESSLETGSATKGGSMLKYAKSIFKRMDKSSALYAWTQAQYNIISGAYSESLLERFQAAAYYSEAYRIAEPLVNNLQLRKELIKDWLRIVYGNTQELLGEEKRAEELVGELIRRHFVNAALAVARSCTDKEANERANTAALVCREFNIPPTVSSLEIHSALDRLPATTRTDLINDILKQYENKKDRKSKSITAILWSLYAKSSPKTNAQIYFDKAVEAAKASFDANAWVIIFSDSIQHKDQNTNSLERSLIELFLSAYSIVEMSLRKTPKYLSFRMYFEPTINLVTSVILNSYENEPTFETSLHLSRILEAHRDSELSIEFSLPLQRLNHLEKANQAATDWLGRIAHAINGHPDTLALIPVSTPNGITFITVSKDSKNAIELHKTSKNFQSAVVKLTKAMHMYFSSKDPRIDWKKLGLEAFESLPKVLRECISNKSTILIAPDYSAKNSEVPYELFKTSKDFLGTTHVLARFTSLRGMAITLELNNHSILNSNRALCVSAPSAVTDQILENANDEIKIISKLLLKHKWSVPLIDESKLKSDLLVQGLQLGSVVHIAAHGEAFNGTYAILLPNNQRLIIDEINSCRGKFNAMVYLSVCSLGASEYLGGGVSRGFANSLIVKGAAAIIASQWPLQDLAAKDLAKIFYKVALETTIGEALRIARNKLMKTVSPALWGSLILIGNPWHRIGILEASKNDTATQLLDLITHLSSTKKANKNLVTSAKLELEQDPDNRRLEAALSWVEETTKLYAQETNSLSAGEVIKLADTASYLNSPNGEVSCLLIARDMFRVDGNEKDYINSLDRAIGLTNEISKRNKKWRNILIELLAERQKLNITQELPQIKLDSGMTVNDQSDPAVLEFLKIQNAFDQQETRQLGELNLRLPIESLEDHCWNAIVLGNKYLFPDEFSCAAFAKQFSLRAIEAGWIKKSVDTELSWVSGGILRYLWSTQRITHLEHQHALAQTRVLLFMLQKIENHVISNNAGDTKCKEEILKLGEEFSQIDLLPNSRFTRARNKLHGKIDGPSVTSLGNGIKDYINNAPSGSYLQGYRAAWSYGLLLALAYKLQLSGQMSLAARIIAEFNTLEKDAESYFFAYLINGFKDEREMAPDPLMDWRVD